MATRLNNLPLVFTSLILFTSFITAGLIVNNPSLTSIGIIALLAIFIISFVNTKIALYILIFSMLLSPEIMMGGLSGKSTAGRGLTVRIEDFLIIVIGMSWFVKSAIHKELGLLSKTPLNTPIFTYIAVCFISTSAGVIGNRVNLMTGFFFILKYIEYYIIYFMVVNNVKTKKDIEHLVLTIFICFAIVSILGILQIPTGKRVSAPFEGEVGEPNTFGGYIVLVMSFAISIILYSKSRYISGLLLLLCIIATPPLLFTLSRSSWLAGFFMYIILFSLSDKKIYLFSALAVILFFGYFFLPENVENRFKYTFKGQKSFVRSESLYGIDLDPSTSERIHRLKQTTVNFQKNPFLGAGITGAGFIDGQYNRILEETGLFGIITFMGIILALYKQAYLLFTTTTDIFFKGLGLGMLAGLSAMLAHALGGNTFIIVRIMEPFWFFTGIIIVANSLNRLENVKADPTQ